MSHIKVSEGNEEYNNLSYDQFREIIKIDLGEYISGEKWFDDLMELFNEFQIDKNHSHFEIYGLKVSSRPEFDHYIRFYVYYQDKTTKCYEIRIDFKNNVKMNEFNPGNIVPKVVEELFENEESTSNKKGIVTEQQYLQLNLFRIFNCTDRNN